MICSSSTLTQIVNLNTDKINDNDFRRLIIPYGSWTMFECYKSIVQKQGGTAKIFVKKQWLIQKNKRLAASFTFSSSILE